MIEKIGRKDSFDSAKFARSLGELIDALPSEANQQQMTLQLETLIEFLSGLRDRLASVPTQEDAKAARAALDQLGLLFTQAKSSPILSAAVGMNVASSRPTVPVANPEDIQNAKLAVARLESLSIDQLRVALDQMSLRELNAMAKSIGVRSTQRTSQAALAHQIATKITNTRGYRSLRDGSDQQGD
jgi:hypothetical protein